MRIERENGDPLGSVWAVLSLEEAQELLLALAYFFDDDERTFPWHCHIGERPDAELSIEIEPTPGSSTVTRPPR